MKKFLALLCMITCIFGLTACGEEAQLNEYDTQKIAYAEDYVEQNIVPMFLEYAKNDEIKEALSFYTLEELEYVFENQNYTMVEGAAVMKAIDSFKAALEEIGEVAEIGEAKAEIDDKTIIVKALIKGSEKNAEAEIILSNDMFTVLESAALNPITSTGDLMGKAALNTLLGMGTVFIVLIIIIVIISSFSLISKVQTAMQENDKNKSAQTGIDNAVAQIVEQEESSAVVNDMELVAVIAAAIAAYEGNSSTDGFVVRSIRKRNR